MKSETALMETPRCPTHNCSMHFRPARTQEQGFCGAWYDCDTSGCACSVLVPSAALLIQLAAQRKMED